MNKIATCAICSKQFSIFGIAHHIKTHEISFKQYYDSYLRKDNEGYCNTCGKPTEFINLTYGYKNYCCKQCRYSDPVVIHNRKQTILSRYGFDVPLKNKEVAKRIGKKSSKTKHEIKAAFIAEHPELITKEQLIEKYGWMWYWDNVIEPVKMLQGGRYTNYYHISDISKIETYIEETIHNNRSHKEMELLRYVQSIYSGTIKHDCKTIITPKEIDIYLPDLKLGIEFNGTRYHSIELGTSKMYHLDKSLRCREQGIRLIHIYEFEDFEEQKRLLKDLIEGKDNYPLRDFNKNNLIEKVPKPSIIYKKDYTIYGAGKLIRK